VHVVVETPRGARAKLTFDPELKTFVLSKSLMLGLSYPYDWGFIPSTRAEDGDPLDAMVIHDAATTPGLVLRCKLIGVLQTIQKTKHDQIRNDRVIAVPTDSHRERELQGVGDLPPEVKEELEKFFVDRRAGGQDVEVPRLARTGAGEKAGSALRKDFQEKELGSD
jgi:inorganic pyrophosphatase